MARDFFINGEAMVLVKGNTATAIPTATQLGLSTDAIHVSLEFRHEEMQVDAWGGRIPPDLQFMLAAANITMNLIHFDRTILDEVWRESMAGAPTVGQLPRAGTRMGNNLPRFGIVGGSNGQGVNGNHYMGLNITSQIGNKPWRFLYAFLAQPPVEFPLGTEKSVVRLNWRAQPYTQDPWNNGLGALGTTLFDYNQDT